jgi:hypothetical protein
MQLKKTKSMRAVTAGRGTRQTTMKFHPVTWAQLKYVIQLMCLMTAYVSQIRATEHDADCRCQPIVVSAAAADRWRLHTGDAQVCAVSGGDNGWQPRLSEYRTLNRYSGVLTSVFSGNLKRANGMGVVVTSKWNGRSVHSGPSISNGLSLSIEPNFPTPRVLYTAGFGMQKNGSRVSNLLLSCDLCLGLESSCALVFTLSDSKLQVSKLRPR